jgi:hypothetical protein
MKICHIKIGQCKRGFNMAKDGPKKLAVITAWVVVLNQGVLDKKMYCPDIFRGQK